MVLAGAAYALVQFGAPRSHEYVAWEETASVIALAVAGGGLVLAFIWEPVGAATALISGVFVGALAAYEFSLLIALGVALLFLVPATLFLLAWHRTQSWLSIIVVGTVMGIVLAMGGGVALAFYMDGHGPTHPESALGELTPSQVLWVWSGGVTTSSAVVAASVPSAQPVRLAYGPSPTLDVPAYAASSLRGPVHRFDLEGLTEATTYHYAVEVGGVIDEGRVGTFTTFSEGPQDLTIAFASCARTGSNGSVFDTIRELQPDLFISTGDFHYGDVLENSLGAFGDLYDLTLTEPAQARLYASVPIAYTWDDHDFGGNDAASDSPSRDAALVSYRTHVPHYEFALAGIDAPIAQAFTVGRIRFILTDTRSARDPRTDPDGPGKTMLGDEQLNWFLAELERSLVEYPLVVWVSSVPWIAEPHSSADHWGGYAYEREEIAAAIAATGHSNRLLLLAGDAHMLAIDDGTNNDYAPGGGASFPVMQAAALDRNGSVKGGPYSEGAYPGGGQFGLMEVNDDGTELRIKLRGLTWESEELVALDLSISGVTP